MIKFDFNEDFLDFFDEHKVPLALAALVGISALANFDSIRQSYASFAEYRDANMSLTSKARMMETTQRASEKSAEIARQRFESGCIPIAAPHDSTIPTAPTAGSTVVDKTTGEPMPAGTVVCYITGHTGILKSEEGSETPIVSELAFTGDIEPVRNAFPDEYIERYRVGISGGDAPESSPKPKPETQGSEGSDPIRALW
jgi:hypothetical protein